MDFENHDCSLRDILAASVIKGSEGGDGEGTSDGASGRKSKSLKSCAATTCWLCDPKDSMHSCEFCDHRDSSLLSL